jgi:hypothetical protein
MKKTILRLAACAVLSLATASAATIVGVELQILVDVSGSVSSAEYALQQAGYAAAFNDSSVIANIAANKGGIAVQVIQWSGVAQQGIAIDWTHLTNAAEAKAFADAVAKMPRLYFGGTSAVQAALLFGSAQFASNGFEGKRISNMVGDGLCNEPAPSCGLAGQAAMAKADVLVNALVVSSDPAVKAYYASDVVTGGGVVFSANSFSDFEKAIIEKVRAETMAEPHTATPEPSSLAMIALGLGALAIRIRRRTAA